MYENYFQLKRTPFRLHSEPDLFYPGKTQKNAMVNLRQALNAHRAVFTLFGLPGTGKTTLVQKMIGDTISADTLVYRLSRAENDDIRISIAQELSERFSDTDEAQQNPIDVVSLFRAIDRTGRNGLLIVDEAQLLTRPEIEFLHELAAADSGSNALTLILIGHTQAKELVNFENGLNYSNTLILHSVLSPLTAQEMRTYVEHRLIECGWKKDPELTNEVFSVGYRLTQGIPRQVNDVFDRLLQYMEFEQLHSFSTTDIDNFCRDLCLELKSIKKKSADEMQILGRLKEHLGEGETARKESGVGQAKDKVKQESTPRNENQNSRKHTEQKDTTVASKTVSTQSKILVEQQPEKEKSAVESRIEQINRALEEGNFGIDHAKHKLVEVEKTQAASAKQKASTAVKQPPASSKSSDVNNSVEKKTAQEKTKVELPVQTKKKETSTTKELKAKKVSSESVLGQRKTAKAKPEENIAKKEPLKPKTQKTSAVVAEQKKEKTEVKEKSSVQGKPERSISWVGIAAGVAVVGIIGVLVFSDGEDEVNEVSQNATMSEPLTVTKSIKPETEVADMAVFESTEKAVEATTPVAEIRSKAVVKSAPVETKVEIPKLAVLEPKDKTDIPKPVENKKKEPVSKKQVVAVKEELKPKANPDNNKIIVAKKIESPKNRVQNKKEPVVIKAIPPAKKVNNEVVVAIPKKEPTTLVVPTSPAQALISDKELRGMMTSFKWFYESGDTRQFARLFTEDARTNDNVVGREAIKKDYDVLFSATESRLIEVRNLNWKKNGKLADGTGLFKLTVINKANGEANEINGQIFVRAEKTKDSKRAKIKGLFYQYNLASK